MKKTKNKKAKRPKLKLWILFLISFISFLYFAIIKDARLSYLDTLEFHFGLMAVAALFGGFLYTNYTLLINLIDHPKIVELKATSVIEKRNQLILNGVFSAVISVSASLCLVIFSTPKYIDGIGMFTLLSNWKYYLYLYVQNIEVVFLAGMIFYFIRSFYDMNQLLCTIKKPDSEIPQDKIDEIKDSIKK